MRRLSLFAAAFLLAVAAFWTTMLTDPPVSEASMSSGIDIRELTIKTQLEPGSASDAI